MSRVAAEVLTGGGAMGALMRDIDWSRTAVGAVETWPQSLRTVLGVVLTSQHPFFVWWGRDLVQFYNDGYRPILGSKKHPAAMGQRGRECWQEIWDVIEPMIARVFAGGSTYLKDGLLVLDRHGFLEECYFDYAYSPIRDESGQVAGVFVACSETTGRVIGERRLKVLGELAGKASEAKSPELACRAAASVLVGEAKHDIPFALMYLLSADGSAAELVAAVGLEPGATLAPLTLLVAAGEAPWPFRLALQNEVELKAAALGDTLPGGPWPEAPTMVMVLPLKRTGASSPRGFLVAGVSPRLALDEAYRGFLRLVAGHVSTAVENARAYEEERQRAEALATLDRAKTAFFSNVSHEFRTPLTLMLAPIEDGLADTVEPLPPVQRERQQLVRRNGLRLQKLVNTLLDFARFEAGRAHASFVPTDLAALTRDLASSFDSAMTSAGLELAVDCPDLPGPVYVDPAMWEKLVLNLLSNALKFTFRGQVRVALEWRGDVVHLSVQDTGTGIPPQELPRIFERFYRVEGARGRSHEGTGIGLALVQELVKLHGGGVDVTSALGRGTTFTVSIPTGSAHLPSDRIDAAARTLTATGIGPGSFLAEVSQWNEGTNDGRDNGADNGGAASVPSATTLAAAPPPPAALHVGARILVADDNADMRRYLSRILSPFWAVELASDGAQALQAARLQPPDLILSDVMMPALGGLELVQALRSDEATRTIPIVLLSARAGEEATIEGLRSGADEYLVKPFSANELLARVNAQLTVSHLRGEALRAERAHVQEATRLLEVSRQATRAREEMLAVVSHDLRSPLNAIAMAIEVIQGAAGVDERNPHWRKHTDVVRRSVSHMNRLIADLLDLASIDAGTFSVQPRLHALDDLLRELRDAVDAQALEKGVSFATEVEANLSAVECDKERVLQALGNLVGNALKFTPRGGSIRVGARACPEGVELAVRDTGAGISPAAMTHIFERYWHSGQQGAAGHGLGLYIVRGIAEAHGGAVRAESVLGQGSAFSILLPTKASGLAGPGAGPAPVGNRHPAGSTVDAGFLEGGGEMSELIRALDWADTPVGAIETWPASLRTSVSTCLNSRFPIVIFWGQQLVKIYNDAYRQLIGTKHPAALGRPGREVWPEIWHVIGPMFERVLNEGKPTWLQNQLLLPNRRGFAEECYFTLSYSAIRDSGDVAGVFSVLTETTAAVLAERRLRTLRELAVHTAHAASTQEACRLALEALGKDLDDLPFALLYLLDQEGKRASLACSAGAPPDTKGTRGKAVLSTEELQQLFGAAPATVLLEVAGPDEQHPAGLLVAGLSERLVLDESYQSFVELVASHIATAIASARALETARARAAALAELDRAKTDFFSNVSHEFRTPLTLILGPVEDALARAPASLSGNELELVRRNALRLYKMVNTLLDFSRMEAGRAQATFVPTDLAAFTTNLASAFESAAASNGLKLVVQCPALPEAVYVDPEMWEKIVLNLLSNAVKYTYQGEIRVALRWQDKQAVLTVQDSGVGIAEEELGRVFERFYRARVTQGRSHEGTGIGLALVRELVALHGGNVEVSSKLGSGSTFTVRLPRGSAHLPSARIERTPRPRSAASGAATFVEEAKRWSVSGPEGALGHREETANEPTPEVSRELAACRILLVDDNADLRSYLAALLGRAFPQIETATNGREALDRIQVQLPDLIVSDVMMPALDGFGLVRALRAHPRTRAIPIILLSARAGDESTVEGLHSGADDYLVKPFSARELMARVCTQLEMARVRREVTKLELAEEQLLAAAKARDEWLAVVSHELRTPLTPLSLSVQMLTDTVASERRSERTSEEIQAKARSAERHLRRLTRLVVHLTDVTELVSGQLQLTCEQTDVAGIAAAVVEESREKAAGVGSPITLRASQGIVGYYDRARLHQLLECLLDNALKFGAGKPVDVTVERVASDASIRVVDHGPGISADAAERVFGRFERAVSSQNYGGFGLGLWIARHLAEAHEGSIHLAATEGGGATCTVRLPLKAPPREA